MDLSRWMHEDGFVVIKMDGGDYVVDYELCM